MAGDHSPLIPDPDKETDPVAKLYQELRIFRHAVNNICHLLMMNVELAAQIPDREKVVVKLVSEKMPKLQQDMMDFSTKFENTFPEIIGKKNSGN